ncbi:hypothetical protein [Cyanobacterium sp. Dongsha4]|uniref:hypothetical protein n=1 Tax=Cyanobacterium sp. DS4 TaxID=2878255 RepID=UPI002E80486C|nr:hypothetical protein [Cyanobacterium sp. Dongsha4]WVL02516.1 hypothetical protein Dongsha4_18650 [Cyanobacterium sp. Dongsha4]
MVDAIVLAHRFLDCGRSGGGGGLGGGGLVGHWLVLLWCGGLGLCRCLISDIIYQILSDCQPNNKKPLGVRGCNSCYCWGLGI